MPELFEFNERPDSRAWTTDPPGVTYRYKASGEHDDGIVRGLRAQRHAAGRLCRRGHTVSRQPPDRPRRAQAVPGHRSLRATQTRNRLVDVPLRHHRRDDQHQGRQGAYRARTRPALRPNPHKGAIGVTKDGKVEGADIVIPALKLIYTFKHPAGVINESHARALAGVTGMTNASPFRGFAAGELLYVGSTGEDGTETEASVDYVLVAIGERDDHASATLPSIFKGGHHVLWIEFKNEVDSGKPAVQPERVHIERVYDPVDFAAAFGWS